MTAATDRASFEIIEDALSDRFRILAYTGGKGLSSLYEAEDLALGRRVGIKCVFFDASAGPDVLEMQKTRFHREAEVTAQLTHPAIIPIFDVTTKPASAFIVMAHIDGDTLRDLLQSGDHLGLSECVDLFSDVANCLDYIHGEGVVHRNVKPANIIVKRPAGAALADFSLAQTRTPSKFTLPSWVSGTPTFMSPEQARGQAVDGRSDLFSFGCILFLCLSGFKPFVGKNPNETMKLVMGPDPPRHVDWEQLGKPAELDGLFRKALAKDVDERFGSGAELIDALRALSASAADRESPSAAVVLVPPAAETPEPLDPKKLKSVREEERALELSPRFSDVVQAVMLTPEEGFVLSRIDGSTSIPRDILSVSPLDEENTTRVLLGMLEKDLIRFRDAETKPKIAPTEKPSSGASGEVKKEDAAETALLKEVEALIAVGKDDPAKILGVDEGADITQIKKAYRERVLRYHPDRHSVVANPDLRDRLSHLLALATEAFGVMSERREKADAVRNAPPVRVASPHPEITPTGSTTALGDETDEFDKEEHAHELFRHAEKAFELQDHWQTIQLCRQAVELYDKEAKFHHLLGVALVRNKKWRKEAAQSFGRAVELEEKNPHYLGLLAAVYKAEGLQLRADKIFNQLLKIDPSYEIPELPA